jgi:hypothetical protein
MNELNAHSRSSLSLKRFFISQRYKTIKAERSEVLNISVD